VGLGERYDSDNIIVRDDGISFNKDRVAEIFDEYNKATNETEFAVHENTAIAIATAVMGGLYPDDDYGIVYLPDYFRPVYYREENCWEVWLHKGARRTTLSTSELISAEVMFVYVDVNSGAVKAIIPRYEFSVHNPANSGRVNNLP